MNEILRWALTVLIFAALALVIVKWAVWEQEQRAERRRRRGF